MKKVVTILAIALSLIAPARAADFYSTDVMRFKQNRVEVLSPLRVTSTVEGDITAEHGLRFIIPQEITDEILWNRVDQITLTGTAVDHQKIAATVTPEYSEDYFSVIIPVLANFEVNEYVQIAGLEMRTYEDDFNFRYLGLDLNQDGEPDVRDINAYSVGTDSTTDLVAPYEPTHFKAELSSDKSKVTLTWNNPPDWDFASVQMTRKSDVNPTPQVIFEYRTFTSYVDKNWSNNAKTLTYTIRATDTRNWSNPVILTVDLTAAPVEPQEPEVPSEPNTPTEPTDELTSSEREVLQRELNYHSIRKAIKCQNVSVTDANCLASRVHTAYLSEKLGVSDSNTALSARDLELLGYQVPFMKKRYENGCIQSSDLEKICPALNQAIERIQYFLDN